MDSDGEILRFTSDEVVYGNVAQAATVHEAAALLERLQSRRRQLHEESIALRMHPIHAIRGQALERFRGCTVLTRTIQQLAPVVVEVETQDIERGLQDLLGA